MTYADVFPRSHGRDLSHLTPIITKTVTDAALEGLCHRMSTSQVLSIWARGVTVETFLCTAKMGELGRG
jgi:hypothetical protein